MNEKTETIIVSVALIAVCLIAYGVSTMNNLSNEHYIIYNGDPEGWNWNINQTNGTIPVQNTSLIIYQEVIEPVKSVTVNGNEIHNIHLDLYHVETKLNGMNVSVYDVMSGMYGTVVIETNEHRYNVVVNDDDIVLKVTEPPVARRSL